MEKKKFDVEFHGTNLFALVPLLLFVVFCILFFVVFKTFDMMHLCMGGYVALIIGSLLSKNWGKYWDAVATGMSSIQDYERAGPDPADRGHVRQADDPRRRGSGLRVAGR